MEYELNCHVLQGKKRLMVDRTARRSPSSDISPLHGTRVPGKGCITIDVMLQAEESEGYEPKKL